MKFIIQGILLSIILNTSYANSWTFTRELSEPPRGGRTIGIDVTYDQKIPSSWERLKEEGISSFERDRRAIYALEGEFEVKFEFLETILMETSRKWDVPYASKGTEFVKVIEDKGDFISLQHIMVLFMKDPHTGETSGPMLVKHWRQDWKWNPTDRFEFQGDNEWSIKSLTPGEGIGRWKWEVYQVDDTPRYTGLGKWTHLKSASTFSSDLMSRPLPRREFSVRSDYKLLLGSDTLIVTPKAWYHEQRNFKHESRLGTNGENNESKLLAREIGHNSYVRIKGFDFSAGYNYWEKSKGYWSDVRSIWDQLLKVEDYFKLRKKVNGMPLYMHHFKNAENPEVANLPSEERKKIIRNLLNQFVIR